MADNETPNPTMKRPTNCKIVTINDLVRTECHQGPGEGNFPWELWAWSAATFAENKGKYSCRTKSRQTCIYLSWVVGMGVEEKANECLIIMFIYIIFRMRYDSHEYISITIIIITIIIIINFKQAFKDSQVLQTKVPMLRLLLQQETKQN